MKKSIISNILAASLWLDFAALCIAAEACAWIPCLAFLAAIPVIAKAVEKTSERR